MAETEQLRKMFVGGLNWETDEDSLRNYFSQWGNIIDCIIMLKPDKTSRGFGFVTFDKAKCVDECLKVRKHELDGRQIEPKRAVPKDEVNNPSVYQKTKKIFVGGLASTTTEEDIEEYFNKLLSEFGEGKIVDIELKRDRETNRIRGFAYVTFDSDEVVEKMVTMRNHEIKMKHCDVKKAESQAQLRRKQEQDGNYRPKFISYQGSASRERSSNSNSMAPSQNMAGFSMGNWGPGFFGGYFGGGVPGQGGFGGPGRGGDSDSGGRGQGGFSGSGSNSSGGGAGNWGLGNWGGPGANFGAGPMGFPGFGAGFPGFGGFPFGFGGMGYGPGFGAGYGAGFGYGGFGPGGSGAGSSIGMSGGGLGSSGSGGGSSSYGSGGSSGPASYGIKSEGDTGSSYSSSERSATGPTSSVAGRESGSAYGYGFGYGGPGMAGQQDWSSLAGFAGYGNYPGMIGGGVGDNKTSTMGTTAAADPYQLGSYNQANSSYGPTVRGAAGRSTTTDVAKRVFRPY